MNHRQCPQCQIYRKNVDSDILYCRAWAAEHPDAGKYLIAAKLADEELEAQKK